VANSLFLLLRPSSRTPDCALNLFGALRNILTFHTEFFLRAPSLISTRVVQGCVGRLDTREFSGPCLASPDSKHWRWYLEQELLTPPGVSLWCLVELPQSLGHSRSTVALIVSKETIVGRQIGSMWHNTYGSNSAGTEAWGMNS